MSTVLSKIKQISIPERSAVGHNATGRQILRSLLQSTTKQIQTLGLTPRKPK